MPGYLCPGRIGITLIPSCVYAIAVSSVVIAQVPQTLIVVLVVLIPLTLGY